MDVFKAVQTVLAVRSYQNKPVPANVVQRIVEAGRLTASGSNKQPWHFIVVENKDTIKRIAAAAPTGPYVAQAPVVILVAIDKSSPLAVSDGSRAVQSMILTAWEEGVGSIWVGYMGPEAVKPIVGIPDSMDLLAILPFGYPTDAKGKGKKNRKPLGEVASRDKLGTPYK